MWNMLHAFSEHQTETVLPGFAKQEVAAPGFDYLVERIWKMKIFFSQVVYMAWDH